MAAEAEGNMPMVRDSPVLCWKGGIGDGTTSRTTVADAFLAYPMLSLPSHLPKASISFPLQRLV